MSNTIDFALGADNKMKALSFYWTAIFKDGSFITQFDPHTNKENLFQLVKDRFSDLDCFILKHFENNLQFKVDLSKGTTSCGSQEIEPNRSLEKENIRLIYFRRIKNQIGSLDWLVKSVDIKHHLGFQFNNAGTNRQIVLIIDSEGNWTTEYK